ncbi:hypothetical protein K493DRAFT_333021 [Basidiobolus meristosporus CBS 931.73]|uniref:Uncharacterized protein n=1 Tax=Basidiobolus meristosporus CBS 931.73 TaxID=1314790 RepID=A0A1Y1Z8W4_9FUNG|nr:hypothetical protein K493DRAFT_333021 [Basidiobolus meristosporus CBS 931.73]|eukprot:ORY06709.1 hypothetical protein K493DRAFT_333021 [Basidiobolus meristosporus CBS 931.73]
MNSDEFIDFPFPQGIESEGPFNMVEKQLDEPNREPENIQAIEMPDKNKLDNISREGIVSHPPKFGEDSRNTRGDDFSFQPTPPVDINHVDVHSASFPTIESEPIQGTIASEYTPRDLGNFTPSPNHNAAFNLMQSRVLSDSSEDFQFPVPTTSYISNHKGYDSANSTDSRAFDSTLSTTHSTPTPHRSINDYQVVSESPSIFEISDNSLSHNSTPSRGYTYPYVNTNGETSAGEYSDDYAKALVDLTPSLRADNMVNDRKMQKRRREESPDQVQYNAGGGRSKSNTQVIDLTDDTDVPEVMPYPTTSKRQRTIAHPNHHADEHFKPNHDFPTPTTVSSQQKTPVFVDLTALDSDEETFTPVSRESTVYRTPFNHDSAGVYRPAASSQFTQHSTLDHKPNPSAHMSQNKLIYEEVCYGMIRCLVVTSRRKLQPNTSDVIEITDDDDDDDDNKLVLYRDRSNRQDPNCIKVCYKKGQELGYLERSSANGLAPLIDARLIRTEGYLPRFGANSHAFVTAINVYLYGRQETAQLVGKGLYGSGLHISEPQDFVPTRTYMNPFNKQALLVENVVPSQTPVDVLYQWLETPIDLPELEPDDRLIPKLYKHQKQALYFLTERERMDKADHESGKFSGSLYKIISGKHDKQVVYKHLITNEETYEKPIEPRGGLLADDMGLGKTISVIALILSTHRRVQEPEDYFSENDQDSDDDFQPPKSNAELELVLPKRINSVPPVEAPRDRDLEDMYVQSQATLIICPLSVVANWEEQFSLHVKKNTLSVYVYHGNNRNTNPRVLAKYVGDIYLISVTSKTNPSAHEGCCDNHIQRSEKHGTKSPLQEVWWLRIVLDEAHVIKDYSTIQSRAACNLSAERRWCLRQAYITQEAVGNIGITGTPVQNKIDDLYSLVKFLQISPLCEFPLWQQIFSRPLKNNENLAVLRLQTLMKCITLRRVKTQECDGKPILQLPPKRDIFAWLEFSEPEQKLYDMVAKEAKEKVNKMLDAANPLKQYMNVLQWILKLRQICAHHGLCDTSVLNLEVKDDTQLKDKAGLLLSILRDSGDDKCQFCFQEAGDLPYLTKCEHIFCQSCATNLILEDFAKGKTCRFCPACGLALAKADVVQVRGEEVPIEPCKLRPGLPEQSTKIQALIQALQTPSLNDEANKEHKPGSIKSVVFSQWTGMLDLIEVALKENNIQFARLDGKMTRVQRSLNIEKFRDSSHVSVILVSLKAGGVGLNLTSAQRVFLMDPYWNPAVENQAIDRVHRLGQKFPVEAVRFMMKNSIEEKIYALQMKKIQLTQMTFREKPENTTPQQRLEDIRYLFQ